MDLAFLSIARGLIVTSPILLWYMHHNGKRLSKMETVIPEERLIPGVVGSVLIPAGLFLFGKGQFQAAYKLQLANVPSLDAPAINTLDCIHDWGWNSLPWDFSFWARYSWIAPIYLPSICRIFVRCQRISPKPLCQCCCSSLASNVYEIGRIWRRKPISRTQCSMYRGYGLPLYVWKTSSGQRQVYPVLAVVRYACGLTLAQMLRGD